MIENNPDCFEGEDLTGAYALEQKLRDYGQPVSSETVQIQVMLPLSEEEARVAGRAELCSHVPTMRVSQPGPATIAPLPEGPAPFPVVPVAVGAGVLGLIALIVAAVR